MDKKLIVVDCDGVVSDIYTPALPFIWEKFKDDKVYSQFHWAMVYNWEMNSIRKDVANYFLELVSDPKYMSKLPVYEGVVVALQRLQALARQYGYQVFMNTAVFNAEVGLVREMWIKELQEQLVDELPFHIQESSKSRLGKDKPIFDAVALIEDNLHVLREHNVKYSYIIDHHHNKEHTNLEFVDVFKRALRVSNIMLAVQDLGVKLAKI